MIYIVIRCSSEIIPTQIPIWRSGIFDKEKRELSLLFNGGSNDYMNCCGRQTISINRIFHFKHFCITIADIPKNITCLRYCIRVVQDKGGKLKFECSILKIVLCVKKINIQHIVLEAKKVKRVAFISDASSMSKAPTCFCLLVGRRFSKDWCLS